MMKKKLIGMLALLLCLTAMPLGAAAYYTEITGLSDEFGEGGYSINGEEVDKRTGLGDFSYLSNIVPGTTYFLPLRAADFEWENGRGNLNSLSVAEELGIELDVDYEKGDEGFDAVKLAERDGRVGIYIDFTDRWPFVEPQEFLVKCNLTVAGEEYRGASFKIKGTITNRSVLVDTNDTKCSLGVGRYAYGFNNVSGVQFNLGAGVTVTSDIGYTDKYYGAAVCKTEDADAAVVAKYPQIKYVYRLETVGLKGNVTIASKESAMYVYDDTLVYLGVTGQAVPFRTTYYVSGSKL